MRYAVYPWSTIGQHWNDTAPANVRPMTKQAKGAPRWCPGRGGSDEHQRPLGSGSAEPGTAIGALGVRRAAVQPEVDQLLVSRGLARGGWGTCAIDDKRAARVHVSGPTISRQRARNRATASHISTK